MNRIIKQFILIMLLLLAGCATTIPDQKLANISTPADLLVRCPDIPKLVSPATLGDTMQYIIDLQQDYNDCAGRYDSLIEINNKPKGN